jgi:hypothetical protein
MPNAIKYSTSAQTLALKKGNYWIGTGDVGKGPTSTTDYYNGITPPAGGYTIYLNKASGGPSIYTAANDSQLISLSNTIAGQTFATAAAALSWFATQTDKMVFNSDYPAIVTDGLVLNLDAGFTPSYPTTGTTWYDVSSGGNNGTLTNGPTFNSANGGSIVFDGSDDIVETNYSGIGGGNPRTIICWIKMAQNKVQRFFSYGVNASSQKWVIRTNDVNFTLRVENALGNYFSTDSQFRIDTGNWVMCTVVYPGGNLHNCNVYVNNTLCTSMTGTNNTVNTSLDNNIRLGTSIFEGQPLEGNMSIVQMYNRALTAAEVLQNYNATKSRFGL